MARLQKGAGSVNQLMLVRIQSSALGVVNGPSDFHRVFLVQRDARGTVRGCGEGRAKGGVTVEEMSSETDDRRGEAQTGSASTRRP